MTEAMIKMRKRQEAVRNHPDRIAAMKKMKEIVQLMEDELNNDKSYIQYSLTIPMLIDNLTEAFYNFADVESSIVVSSFEEEQ